MILNDCYVVLDRDIRRFAWSEIRRFHNVDSVQNILIGLHKVEARYKKYVRKQAEQIKFCLLQAKEYYDAASAVSLSTRPVLLYYSAMSLALAEILLKHDGESSLDRARGQHRHHGLVFKYGPKSESADDLGSKAKQLRAVPLAKENGQRVGTFALWHRSAREMPIIGKATTYQSSGSSYRYDILFGAVDEKLDNVDDSGVDLLTCFQFLPGMHGYMHRAGLRSQLLRGTVSAIWQTDSQRSSSKTFIIHPGDEDLIAQLEDNIFVNPNDIAQVDIRHFQSGFHLGLNTDTMNNRVRISFPHSSMWNQDEFMMSSRRSSLNEFGYIYYGLFICGMYARYFPDFWLKDLENNSPLALAVESFVDMVYERMPLLALSELSRTYYVPET